MYSFKYVSFIILYSFGLCTFCCKLKFLLFLVICISLLFWKKFYMKYYLLCFVLFLNICQTLYRLWDRANNTEAKNRQVGATRESTLPMVAGLSTEHHQGRRILSLPLWAVLQALGRDGVHARIRDNFLASEKLWAAIDVYRHVRVLVSSLWFLVFSLW